MTGGSVIPRYDPLPADRAEALAERARSGDVDARNEMVLSLVGVVRANAAAMARRRFRVRHIGKEDLVQEGLLHLCRTVGRWRFVEADGVRSAPLPAVAAVWSYQGMGTAYRRAARHLSRLAGGDADGDDILAAIPPAAADADLSDVSGPLRECVDSLPPGRAEVVKMRFGLGGEPPMSFVQIAARRGGSPQNAAQLCDRALKQLRRAVGDRLPGLARSLRGNPDPCPSRFRPPRSPGRAL